MHGMKSIMNKENTNSNIYVHLNLEFYMLTLKAIFLIIVNLTKLRHSSEIREYSEREMKCTPGTTSQAAKSFFPTSKKSL